MEKINRREKTALIVSGRGKYGSDPENGLSIVVFVAGNIIAKKTVDAALHFARCALSFRFDHEE